MDLRGLSLSLRGSHRVYNNLDCTLDILVLVVDIRFLLYSSQECYFCQGAVESLLRTPPLLSLSSSPCVCSPRIGWAAQT